MKKLLIAVLSFASMCGAAKTASACGYGGFDADVETFCTGDPAQAEVALANLVRQGRAALPKIQRYFERATAQRKSYERYLRRLETRDPTLKLDDGQTETEIQRCEKWLDWSRTRMRKIDYLLFRFGGRPFALNRIFRVYAA